MFKWWKKKANPNDPASEDEDGPSSEETETPRRDQWDGDPVSETPTFRGDYEGEGVWYECGNCEAVHEIEEAPSYRRLIEDLCRDVGESSRAIMEEFDIYGAGRWNALREEGLFKFTTEDGRTCIAPYGTVASWNDVSHSWLWAWAMPEGWIEDAEKAVCLKLKARADEEGDWDPVEYPRLFVNEHEAWHLTNLAAWVNDMPLTYRAKVNEINWQYFAIGRPKWTH